MLQPDLPGIEFGSSWYEESTTIGFSSNLYAETIATNLSLDFCHQPIAGWNSWQESKVFTVALGQPLPKTIGFSFPESPHWMKKAESKETLNKPAEAIKPPRDTDGEKHGKLQRHHQN